jgi:hypothetical protein
MVVAGWRIGAAKCGAARAHAQSAGVRLRDGAVPPPDSTGALRRGAQMSEILTTPPFGSNSGARHGPSMVIGDSMAKG